MKIEYQQNREASLFSEINVGDVFEVDRGYYLKILNGYHIENAFDLKNNRAVQFGFDSTVYKLNAKVVIE